MKPKQYILLSLILCLIIATYIPNTPCEHKSILTEIQGLKTAITALDIDRALVDRIEELTRENLIKDQIISDYEAQIEEFGWLKTAMDKEGVNP
jgi:hypothetical protein